MLNFAEQTGSGAVTVVWSFLSHRHNTNNITRMTYILTKYASIRSIYQDVSCQASIERERVRDNVRWGAWLGRHICWIIMVYVVIMCQHDTWHGTTHGTSLCCIACHCHNHNMIRRIILSSLFIYIWVWVAERRTMRPQRSFSIVTSLKWSEKSFALAALAGFFISHFLSLACTPDQPGLYCRPRGIINL